MKMPSWSATWKVICIGSRATTGILLRVIVSILRRFRFVVCPRLARYTSRRAAVGSLRYNWFNDGRRRLMRIAHATVGPITSSRFGSMK